jgi:Mrp family chromosome partitioning ATPase
MSLVEKALSKMKDAERRAREAATPSPVPVEADAAMPAVSPSVAPVTPAVGPLDTTATLRAARPPRRRLAATTETLRSRGYLPAIEQERELTEQYRHVKRPLVGRATLLPERPDGRRMSLIMVTSALPGEGKTFTAINLARSLANERDASVLLLDADVANPRATEILGTLGERGLVDALLDESLDPETLVCDTELGLQFMPAGTHTDLGAELFGSRQFVATLDRLLEAVPGRLILIDTAPLLVTNEGKSLATMPGQVVMVVHADRTPQQAVIEAAGLFAKDQYVGVVLNQSDEAVGSNYYYGSYGYGRYGYGKGKQDAEVQSR